MLELYNHVHPGDDLRLLGELNLLLAETDTDQFPTTPRGVLYQKLQPALDCISDHITDRVPDEKELARLCGYSTGYFRRLFQEYSGITLTGYIQQKKVNRAVAMLRTGMFSVSEIASILGFSDIYYFSAVFKRVCGISPSNYMKAQKK